VAAAFNPNDYKAEIIRAVKDSKQRNLHLDGDIKLSFFPGIGANLGKVSLSEYNSDQQFASVETARVSLALLPLLRKQVVVNEVAVSGLTAALVKHKDGTTNIDDLLGEDKPSKQQSQQVKFDIASVSIERTNLAYRDETTGAQYAIKNLKLKTGRIANGVPGKIELSLEVQANQPKLDINAQMTTTLTVDPDKRRYRLQGLDLQASGAALNISDLKLKVGGDASADLTTQEFGAKKFTLHTTGVIDKNNFEATLDAPALNLTADKFSGDQLTLNAKLDGASGNLAAALSLPGLEGSAKSFKSSELALNLDVMQPGQTLKMKLSSPLSGNFQAQQFNLSNLTVAVNATGDKLPNKSVSSEMKGSLQVDALKQNLQANLAGGLLQSQVKVSVGANGFANPAIQFDMEVDQFDADLYLPNGHGKDATPENEIRHARSPLSNFPPQAGERANESLREFHVQKTAEALKTKELEQPFDLSGLRKLNLNGSLRIGSLKVANVKSARVRLDVKTYNGPMNINPQSANFLHLERSQAIKTRLKLSFNDTLQKNRISAFRPIKSQTKPVNAGSSPA